MSINFKIAAQQSKFSLKFPSLFVDFINKFLTILAFGLAILLISACSTSAVGPEAYKHLTAAQILAGGEKALAKRNYKEASRYFEAIDALYPFDPEVKQSQLDVIYAYYKDGEVDAAIAAADRYIQLYPQGTHTDYAYYMKGVMNFDRGKSWFQKWRPTKVEQRDMAYMQQAFMCFGDLIRLFPESTFAKDAYVRMHYIRHLLAQHELNVAEYYFNRKAYVAAANRASYIVEHLQSASQTAAALKIMVKSYRALGAKEEAGDALQVLRTNYPQEKI